MNFAEWIDTCLTERGWSRREAARRGGFSPSMLDKVLTGSSKPGIRFLEGISRAFDLPLAEVVLRSSGEYRENENVVAAFNTLLNELTDEELEEVLAYGRMKLERRLKKEQSADKKNEPVKHRLECS